MSRYRTIHCLIWNDDKFPFCSDEAKLVFFHVLTTPMSNQFGCFKAGMAALAEEMRWDPEAYRKAFTEGLEKGFFEYDERHHVVYLRCFLKYNPPQSPNVLRSWYKTFKELPPSKLKIKLYNNLEAYVEGLGKGFRKAFGETFTEGIAKAMPNQEQEQEQ